MSDDKLRELRELRDRLHTLDEESVDIVRKIHALSCDVCGGKGIIPTSVPTTGEDERA